MSAEQPRCDGSGVFYLEADGKRTPIGNCPGCPACERPKCDGSGGKPGTPIHLLNMGIDAVCPGCPACRLECGVCGKETDRLYGGEGKYVAQCWDCWADCQGDPPPAGVPNAHTLEGPDA